MRHGTTPLSLLGGVAIAIRLHIQCGLRRKMKRNGQFGFRTIGQKLLRVQLVGQGLDWVCMGLGPSIAHYKIN
jgi:hypothetical protein